jgi:hypothetical protein
MVVYRGIPSSVNIKYTGGSTLFYNGTNVSGSRNGSGSGSGNTFMNTSPTLLSGYITRVNNIVRQLIATQNKGNAKMTALERLNVIEQLMELDRKKGLF